MYIIVSYFMSTKEHEQNSTTGYFNKTVHNRVYVSSSGPEQKTLFSKAHGRKPKLSFNAMVPLMMILKIKIMLY